MLFAKEKVMYLKFTVLSKNCSEVFTAFNCSKSN